MIESSSDVLADWDVWSGAHHEYAGSPVILFEKRITNSYQFTVFFALTTLVNLSMRAICLVGDSQINRPMTPEEIDACNPNGMKALKLMFKRGVRTAEKYHGVTK